jgi:hypothetical protein
MVALDLMAGLQPPVLAVAVAQQIRVRMVHPLRGAMGVMELRLAFLGLQFLTLVGVGAGLGGSRRLWHCHPQVRSNPGHDC